MSLPALSSCSSFRADFPASVIVHSIFIVTVALKSNCLIKYVQLYFENYHILLEYYAHYIFWQGRGKKGKSCCSSPCWQRSLLDSPSFSLPLTLGTAPRENPLNSTGSHDTFGGDFPLLTEVLNVFGMWMVFLYSIMVFLWGRDGCVLIWALASSCHPDFNGAEQVHTPLSSSLRSHNQADLCNRQIHISHWPCSLHFTKMETNAGMIYHTSQVSGEKKKEKETWLNQ